MMNLKRSLWMVLLFPLIALTQSYQTGTVLKWETKPYSQSAHIIRNHVVYSIRVGEARYEIARRSDKVEMNAGQKIDCRTEEGFMFVRNVKGKETKYQIIGSE